MVSFLQPEKISAALARKRPADPAFVRDILSKAAALQGLTWEETADLLAIDSPDLLAELFQTARGIKETIYGKRLVLFAPLYISNLCGNECLYCAFRAKNREIKRRALSQEEIALETRTLIDQGHKRVLLVAGESYPKEGLRYIFNAIETVYGV